MDKQREIMSDTDTQEVQGGHWINHEQEDKKDRLDVVMPARGCFSWATVFTS